MKKMIALFLILSLSACVEEVDLGTVEEAVLAPDAGVEEGRKGGETAHCTSNCG